MFIQKLNAFFKSTNLLFPVYVFIHYRTTNRWKSNEVLFGIMSILLKRSSHYSKLSLKYSHGYTKFWDFTTLNLGDETSFGSVTTLLRILCIILIITTTTERSFSTLRRLNTYLRNNIGQVCHNGLPMLNIHCDISIIAASK